MRKLRKIELMSFVGIAIAALVLYLILHSEPAYQGKRISAWLDDWAAHTTNDYRTAVREIGLNGLPYAVDNLARNDSTWRDRYRQLQPKFPKLLRDIMPTP